MIVDLRRFLDQTVRLPLRDEPLAGGDYLTLPLHAAVFFNAEVEAELRRDMQRQLFDAATIDEVVDLIRSQTLVISLGMRGEYLLLSIGSDNAHLEQLGRGVSLAESDALAPVRKHFQPRLLGLSYTHADLTSYGKLDVDGIVGGLQDLLASATAELPPGLYERLSRDATQLLNEINQALPDSEPKVAASFWRDGIESYTFSALFPGSMDSSEPLGILSHAGPLPILAMAAHSPPKLASYNQLARWFSVAYGYFDDYVVPNIPPENLEDFRQFETLFLPAIQELHVVTRDLLLPSLDGGQSLFVLDAGGAMTKSPQDQSALPLPVRYPRPAIVTEVQDPAKFVLAWSRYREIFNSVMAKNVEANPGMTLVEIPTPERRSLGNGTLFTYAIPSEYDPSVYLDDDFEPHVLLTPTQLRVFSLAAAVIAADCQKRAAKLLARRPGTAGGAGDLVRLCGTERSALRRRGRSLEHRAARRIRRLQHRDACENPRRQVTQGARRGERLSKL